MIPFCFGELKLPMSLEQCRDPALGMELYAEVGIELINTFNVN